MNRKKRLMTIFLVPVIAVIVAQGLVPLLAMIFSGIRSKMSGNVIDLDNHTVENRQVVLENDMVEHWRSIYKEQNLLNDTLSQVLDDQGIDIKKFLQDDNAQMQYLNQTFPDMVDALQYNTTSGVFLILANEQITEDSLYVTLTHRIRRHPTQTFFLRGAARNFPRTGQYPLTVPGPRISHLMEADADHVMISSIFHTRLPWNISVQGW